jgi:hypothetical protein
MSISNQKKVELLNKHQTHLTNFEQYIKAGSQRGAKVAKAFHQKWLNSLNQEELEFLKNPSVSHAGIEDIDYIDAKKLFDSVHDIRGYNAEDLAKEREASCQLFSGGYTSKPGECDSNSNKYHSTMIQNILFNEGINPSTQLLEKFGNSAAKITLPAKQGIPHITHHIWVGHQDENGNFKQPNSVNKEVTLQTTDKFDSSWKHYFWTNNIKSVPAEIINDRRFEIKIIDQEELELKDKIDLLSQSKYFAVAASDITRLAILNKFGGVYLDMDYKLTKSLNELADNYDYVSGNDQPKGYIGNAFIMAHANHSVIKGALDLIARNLDSSLAPEHILNPFVLFGWVIMATGPGALTTAYFNNANQDGSKDLNFNSGIVFDFAKAIDALEGKIPSITESNYGDYLSPESLGNDRFGGTWANGNFFDPKFIDANHNEIFGSIYTSTETMA